MGLDNGLILHSKEKIDFPDEVRVRDWWESNGCYHYSLCYWRKCWNIRHEMAQIISAPMDYVAKYDLDITEVKNFWRALNELNSEYGWAQGQSIWTYEEMKEHLNDDLLIIEWLISFMRENQKARGEEFWVEFYDSY